MRAKIKDERGGLLVFNRLCIIPFVQNRLEVDDEYLEYDPPGRDVDPCVEDHHHRQRQVEGAHRRVQLPAMDMSSLFIFY